MGAESLGPLTLSTASTAGVVTTRRRPYPCGPGVPGVLVKLPVTVVVAPAVTLTLFWHAGGVQSATGPKQTVCVPGRKAVYTPQSSRSMPSIVMVESSDGLVTTWM